MMFYTDTPPAIEQPAEPAAKAPCIDPATFHQKLWEKYHEAPIGIGRGDHGTLLEITVNPFSADSTWTLVGITEKGCVRILTSGDTWAPVHWGAPAR